MVAALKPSRERPSDYRAHRERCNHWQGAPKDSNTREQDAFAMQCSILNSLTEFSPITRADIDETVAYDFGSFDVRAMHRNLAKLIRYGWVERTEEYNLATGNMNPVYRRLRRDDPPRPHRHAVRPLVEPLNAIPVGPWSGYFVLMVSERYSPRPMGPVSIKRMRKKCPAGYFRPSEDTKSRRRAIRAARRTTAGSPDSPPPAANASPPVRPRSAARRAR